MTAKKEKKMTRKFVQSFDKGLSTFLPKGAVNRIAAKFQQPYTSISLIVTSGRWEDDAVVTAAIEEIRTDVERKKDLLEQWEQLGVKK